MRVAGWTLKQIAQRYGLTRQRVAQIVDSSEHGRVPRGQASAIRRVQRVSASRADGRAGEVLVLWRQGVSREEIRVRVGLTLEAIREIVSERATDADTTARQEACRARLGVGVAPQFSEQELIDGLWLVSERLGRVPSMSEYGRAASDLQLACAATIRARFGGWGPALDAAGLPHSSGVSGPKARWDAAACWDALLSVADQLGEPPKYRRYAELAADRDDLPSGSTLTLRLGLWSAIAAAISEPTASAAARDVRERIAA